MGSDSVQKLKSKSGISLNRSLSVLSISAAVQPSDKPAFSSEDADEGGFEPALPLVWAWASLDRLLLLFG
jgi:hypothetical protein